MCVLYIYVIEKWSAQAKRLPTTRHIMADFRSFEFNRLFSKNMNICVEKKPFANVETLCKMTKRERGEQELGDVQ